MKAETKTFALPQTIFEITVEKETENETSLPDYLPNINRLIRVEEHPIIESVETTSDKAVLNGKCVFNVLYESDYKDKVYQAIFSTPFEQKFDLNSQSYRTGVESNALNDELFTDCSASSSFVGCKLLSPRKLLLKSRDNIHFNAKKESVYETPDKDKSTVPTFYKTETMAYISYVKPLEREYELTETISLSAEEPNIGEIVFTNATLSAPYISNEDGTLTINADAYIKMLYENEEGTDYYSKTDIIPLSLTVDDDSLNADSVTFIKLWIPEINAEKAIDEYGEPRKTDVSFTVKALINILKTRETDAVTDVFSPDYDHEPIKKHISYDELAEIKESEITLEKIFETPDVDITSILDASTVLSVTECSYENETVTVKGNADISVLGKIGNENAKLGAVDFSVTFTETFKSNAPDNTKFKCDITPSSISAKMTGKNKLSVKTNAKATLYGIRSNKKEIIASTTLTESDTKKDNGKIIIYYPSQNDTLWNIAKRYSCSPSAIRSRNENAFSDDEKIVKGTKLIIIPDTNTDE